MIIGAVTVANPIEIERTTTYMQVRNQPLGAITRKDIEPNARLTILRLTWDGLTYEEKTALMNQLYALEDAYMKIATPYLRGGSGGTADSEYVTIRPGSQVIFQLSQEGIVTSPVSAQPMLLYSAQAEFLTYPYT